MSTIVERAAKLLDAITETATESMPPLSDTSPTIGVDVKQRWVAERNQRVNNLVALVAAQRVSDAVDGLDKALDGIQRAVEILPGV